MMNKVFVSMTQLVPYNGNRAEAVLTNILLRGDGTMIRILYREDMTIVEELEIRSK